MKYCCPVSARIQPTLFEGLSQQQWFQGRVQFLADVFQQQRVAERNAVLQRPHVVWVGQLDHQQLVVLLSRDRGWQQRLKNDLHFVSSIRTSNLVT